MTELKRNGSFAPLRLALDSRLLRHDHEQACGNAPPFNGNESEIRTQVALFTRTSLILSETAVFFTYTINRKQNIMDLIRQVRQRKKVEEELVLSALQDDNFREELLQNPQTVLQEQYGLSVPDKVDVKIVEEDEDQIVLVLPSDGKTSLETDEEISLEGLEQVAGGGGGDDSEEKDEW